MRVQNVPCVAALVVMMSSSTWAGGRSWHDVLQEHFAFDRKYVIEAYKEHGRQDPKWDKSVLQLLEAQTYATTVTEKHVIYQSNKSPMRADQRAALAHRVIDAGCDDPMALYMAARALDENRERAAAADLFRRADEGFAESKYTAVYQLMAIRDWVERRTDLGENTEPLAKMRDRFRPAFKSVFANKEYFPTYRQVVWDKLVFLFDDGDEKRLLRVAGEMEDVVDPDPWLFNTYMGNVEITRGWEARGRGWANTVTPEGWKSLAEHLGKAREHLDKAALADERLPHPCAFLITVAMGESDAEAMKQAFDAAVARQPDFTAAYTKRLSGLEPRWGGSYEEMLQVGLEAAKSTDYTTRTPAMLLEAINAIESDRERLFEKSDLERLYPLVESMLDAYIAGAESEPIVRWAQTQKMIWSFRMQKWDVARAAYDAIEGDIFSKILGDYGLETFDTMGQIFAMSGPAKDGVVAALETTNPSARRQAFQQVIEGMTNEDRARPWLQRKVRSAELAEQLEPGEWIDYPISKDLKGWRIDRGDWSADEEGALIGKPLRGLSIVGDLELPNEFELRCEVECIGRSGDTPRRVYLFPGWRREQEMGMFLDLEARHMIVVINRSSVETVPLVVEEPIAKVHIALKGDQLLVMADGVPMQKVALPGLAERPRRLALGGFNAQVGTSWRFSRIQLRKYRAE